MSASSGDRGGVAVKQQDGDWTVAPNTPMEDPPDVPQPMNVMTSVPEDDEFIEDDADPDKAALKKIRQIDKEVDAVSSILLSAEDEKVLAEEGAPTKAELLSMGQGAMNNMSLQLGISERVLQEWMVDETLYDLEDVVAQII